MEPMETVDAAKTGASGFSMQFNARRASEHTRIPVRVVFIKNKVVCFI
jgi:hypothetical protein